MTRFGWLIVGGFILMCAIIAALFVWHEVRQPQQQMPQTQATTTPVVDPASLAIYTSGQYGFTFFYPANGMVSDAFTATTTNGLSWRQGATAPGTLIVSVKTNDGEARVGISSAAKELAACEKAGPAEKSVGSLSVASTTWNRFSFQKLGTDDEEQVTSYRVVHNGECYALETFAPLSLTTATTTFSLGDLAQSFTFAK